MKDIIYIKDLRVKTIIGIFDWERKVKQEVSIDLEFPFDCKKAAATDSIEDTVDYKVNCKRRNKICRRIIISTSRNSC
jgi:dihydroneopterin aldolase